MSNASSKVSSGAISVHLVEGGPVPEGCAGYLESIWANGCEVPTAYVSGWGACVAGTSLWLETETGERFPLAKAFRHVRQDLIESDHPALGRAGGPLAGFHAGLQGVRAGSIVRLRLVVDDYIVTLAELQATPLPQDPLAAFRRMHGHATAIGRLAERFNLAEWLVLQDLLDRQQERMDDLPTDVHEFGHAPAQPQVSIIIPLYRRMDFVELQLLKFSRDPWLLAHAEIIYVVDDPGLVEAIRSSATAWFDLYRVPFKWVWAYANRGFSGANNVGAAKARANHLIFMNSDVFPITPGWAQSLVQVLIDKPEVGAVAPRLLYADGSIQHEGMNFRYAVELGIWTNYHPNRGLPPESVEEGALVERPAVTGACLTVRSKDFRRVDGWDTGYLIGDFEDSDLCLKLRRAGLRSMCLLSANLVHLERQSLQQLGEPGFRTSVVILNAVRHQNRWRQDIEKLAQTETSTEASA